jgi:hypothetical protein
VHVQELTAMVRHRPIRRHALLNLTPGSLAGLRVIDLSRVLGGPYCTQILADHGAEVVKVEPPNGDETRTWGPPFDGDTASYFVGVNRNKLGVALDLTQESDRQKLLTLLDTADVLVENFKIGTLERWGLGYDALQARYPRLVHCRVSGFGADGPLGALPGYDAAVQALTGLMSVNGEAGGAPLRIGVPIVDLVTGLNAALGCVNARRADVVSSSSRRCSTVRCRSCIRIRRTGSTRAKSRNAAVTRIRTSRRTTCFIPVASIFFWRWATTRSSRDCAP